MNRIKILRNEYGDRQIDLAEYLGIEQSRLSHWERGVNEPSNEYIFRIADRYGVSTDYLMGYSDSRVFAEPNPIRILREYLHETTGIDYKMEQLIALDRIYQDIAKLLT